MKKRLFAYFECTSREWQGNFVDAFREWQSSFIDVFREWQAIFIDLFREWQTIFECVNYDLKG